MVFRVVPTFSDRHRKYHAKQQLDTHEIECDKGRDERWQPFDQNGSYFLSLFFLLEHVMLMPVLLLRFFFNFCPHVQMRRPTQHPDYVASQLRTEIDRLLDVLRFPFNINQKRSQFCLLMSFVDAGNLGAMNS